MKKMYFRAGFYLLILAMVILPPLSAFAEDIVIICNKGVTVNAITKSDLERIYLGQKNLWDGGGAIEPVMLQNELTESFLTDYVGKNASTFGNYWKKMLFSGKGNGPKQFTKPKEVVDFVANTQGAIGFVPAGTNSDTVKIVPVSK